MDLLVGVTSTRIKSETQYVISGFLHEVDEDCALLAYYAVLSTIILLNYRRYHHHHRHHHHHYDSTTHCQT